MTTIDPIVLGAVFGGAVQVGLSRRNPLTPTNLGHRFVIGAVGGGWGGWMASEFMTTPSAFSILACSIVGVVVFNHFLRL